MKNWTHKNFVIHEFESLKSTNSHAFELANLKKITDGEIILAKSQTGGRGRQNRSWSSPAGNLYFSLFLQPKISAQKIPQISFVAIVALKLAIEKLAPLDEPLRQAQGLLGDLKLKWPNDLLIDRKKVAGILLESKISGKNSEFVILGIGVNIDSNPDNVIFPATNLKNFGIKISPQELLKNFIDEFEKIYKSWLDFGFENIRKLWLKNAYHFQKEITITLDNKQIKGIFENFDEEGNLILKTAEKTLKISAADMA
jgi:BirA family biotin operon repressor/biotin-[acetyl-CoA-carboxylase] ligase